jgi:hydroxymethylbilane synthase
MVLARAGVVRLGLESRIGEVLSERVMLPAVGQGALAVETRETDSPALELVGTLDHADTRSAVRAERALLRRLEGGCQIPIGAYARVENIGGTVKLILDAVIGSLDGRTVVKGRNEGAVHEAETIGTRLAETLLEQGGAEILAEIRSHPSPGLDTEFEA